MLEARAVDALLEVALPVEEPDADDGQREIARLLEDVPCERAESPRVDRQGRVDAELRADERNRARRGLDRRVRPGTVVLEDSREPLDALADRAVAAGGLERVRREILELSAPGCGR